MCGHFAGLFNRFLKCAGILQDCLIVFLNARAFCRLQSTLKYSAILLPSAKSAFILSIKKQKCFFRPFFFLPFILRHSFFGYSFNNYFYMFAKRIYKNNLLNSLLLLIICIYLQRFKMVYLTINHTLTIKSKRILIKKLPKS